MEIILQTKVPNLGKIGDRVKVKNGYARNYLLPQGLAVSATKEHIAAFESRRAELEQKAAEVLKAASQRAEKLQGLSVTIEVQASDEGKLYGSIGTYEISHAITEQCHTPIQKREVRLPNGVLRNTGEYTIELALHSDVIVPVKVLVVAVK